MTPVKRLKRLVFELEYFFLFQISCIYIDSKKISFHPPFNQQCPMKHLFFVRQVYENVSSFLGGVLFLLCCFGESCFSF